MTAPLSESELKDAKIWCDWRKTQPVDRAPEYVADDMQLVVSRLIAEVERLQSARDNLAVELEHVYERYTAGHVVRDLLRLIEIAKQP